MIEYDFLVTDSFCNIRIDKYLVVEIPDVSRSFLSSLIKNGGVFVNDKPIKPSYKIAVNDRISVKLPDVEETDIVPVDIPVPILYEDKDVIVVNKPKGMPVHPSNGHFDDTLVNSLLFTHKDELSGINGVLRPGIVHRIDMDTTGSLIVCKNDRAHNIIAEQIKCHSIKREYVGIVHGRLKEEDFIVDKPIGRDKNNRLKMAVVLDGKVAKTSVFLLEYFKDFTYAKFVLHTGRTHQIRVHMQSIGHPILGDELYGPKKSLFKLQGQTLHAKTIGFNRPSDNKYIEVKAPLPEYFEDLLVKLRGR